MAGIIQEPADNSDEAFMAQALEQARAASRAGEVPVGAILVIGGTVVARAHNSPIIRNDPTAHAEMMVLRDTAASQGNYRLTDATLYVTLEPCPMCAGAMVNARIKRLVFGSRDLRFGGVRSKFQIADSDLLNHRIAVREGVL
ncbi:MAG TPA: tRNA adenosine(34) deaminase TadA, partial [Bryobacteraceae bacterium]|nr:tRNA adenosine(34) deaminase TadA [Bryobacteraceae bacterium]